MFEQSVTNAVAEYKASRSTALQTREEKLEAQRDIHEEKIQEIIGRELNPTEMYLLRYQFRQVEECESALEEIAERLKD